ncbi:hypothetical protein O181_042715 [Austropuccinia psidii MF-1]|uniref:Reverse transcriptase Ty1/copia-type domain-containing protein n=1 Tax=Austropuccinia psidii MF-1 TaxID=1389203 RepID=A0A9Q3DL63_9BASI|nr:hypothetical protein [Austropuccinia psidii MF-1]
MLNATNLTKQYWAEAINTTTFISNLTPTTPRNNQSPAAIWNNNQPTLTKLRVFGCQAITFKLKKEHSWKLDQRGQEGIMLGYESENTAYQILQLHERKIIITRHVKFNEKIFPKISTNTSHEEKWKGITEEQSEIATASITNNDHTIETEAEAQQSIQEINENRENNEGSNTNLNKLNILPYNRRARVLLTTIEETPNTYKQALQSDRKQQWMNAVNNKLENMNKLKVWDIIEIREDYKLIGMSWVFKIKKNHLNEITEYKATLCAQGFAQTLGIDVHKTYAPTGRLNSLRTLIAFASHSNLKFHQINIKTPLAWYTRLKEWLNKSQFHMCKPDLCVFYRLGKHPLWLYIHVNNIALFGNKVDQFKKDISSESEIKDIGEADLLLGIKINHLDNGISLNQQHFIESKLNLYGMSDCKQVSTPLTSQYHLKPATDQEIQEFNKLKINYRSAIGSINFLSTATRSDLSFSGVKAFSNADWRNCRISRRSIAGYLACLHDNLVIWKTKKQPSISISTAEAEYKALCDLTSELVWFKQWCKESQIFKFTNPITIYEVNQSFIKVANEDSNINNKRMKHFDIQLHFVKEEIQSEAIALQYISSEDMLADFLTKSVNSTILKKGLMKLGIMHLGVKGDERYPLISTEECTL